MPTVRVRKHGVFPLPVALREKYGIRDGDTLHVVDLDGVFALTPTAPAVPELAREIETLREEAGLSTQELLEALRRDRARAHEERSGDGRD